MTETQTSSKSSLNGIRIKVRVSVGVRVINLLLTVMSNCLHNFCNGGPLRWQKGTICSLNVSGVDNYRKVPILKSYQKLSNN